MKNCGTEILDELNLTRTVRLNSDWGLHARCAMRLVMLAKQFDSSITVSGRNGTASAVDVGEILLLLAENGEELEISADGDDAQEALLQVSDLLENGLQTKGRC